MKYHFRIYKESKGYWAECVELTGCQTQGANMFELRQNMKEVLNLFLDEPPESDFIFPEPKKVLKGKAIEQVPVEPHIAFALFLRHERQKRDLTQMQAARIMGFNNVWSYQKLESGKKAKPGFDTLIKVKKAFPGFPFDRVFDSDDT